MGDPHKEFLLRVKIKTATEVEAEPLAEERFQDNKAGNSATKIFPLPRKAEEVNAEEATAKEVKGLPLEDAAEEENPIKEQKLKEDRLQPKACRHIPPHTS